MFDANVHPENVAMLEVFSHSGFAIRVTSEPGLVQLAFPTAMTQDAALAFEGREEAAAVRAILNPRSIAVIGAGRHPGHGRWRNLPRSFGGALRRAVVPVHPDAAKFRQSRPTLVSRRYLDEIDLAVVVVPAESVVGVARERAAKGVHAPCGDLSRVRRDWT